MDDFSHTLMNCGRICCGIILIVLYDTGNVIEYSIGPGTLQGV